MKRVSLTFIAFAVTGLVAASALGAGNRSAPASASVLIRHELHGCHSWSANGAPFAPSQSLAIKAGGTVTFTNNDVMPQKLVELSGAAVTYAGSRALGKPASTVRVTFAKAGRYVFGTKPGEDYVKGVKTIGEDNVLKLVVTVK